ncbi:MAG: sortase [Candidatus Saccharibacteria bacterium]
MSASSEKPTMLEQHGLRLGQKIARPESFKADFAWNTPRFSFQVDLKTQICRRISLDANPDIYVALVAIEAIQTSTPKPKRSYRMARLGLGTIAAAAAFLLIYPFYPAAKYQVDRKIVETISHTSALATTPENISVGNRVMIPKIGVDTAILEGSSLAVLNKADGVWHEMGDQPNNFVLAGHRFKYLPPNSSTLYNLNKVSAGDAVVIDLDHKRYIYVVTSIETVSKNDIAIRNPTATPTITIYSCEEASQAHRIVVHAKLL